MKYLLGFDIGSSSVKATLLEIASGKTVASAFSLHQKCPCNHHNQGLQTRP
jgi:xylulokinase